jgi:hypothetical protein
VRAGNERRFRHNSRARENKRQHGQRSFFRGVTAVYGTSRHFIAVVPAVHVIFVRILPMVPMKRAMIAVAASDRRNATGQCGQWRVQQDCGEEA